MAWTNSNGGKQAAKTDRKYPKQQCTDWLLYCFGQQVSKSGCYLIMNCKIHTGKLPDGNYAPSISVTVMARIQPDQDGHMTQIEERDYAKTWIRVDGQMSTDTYQDKNGVWHAQLQMWASAVRLSEDAPS